MNAPDFRRRRVPGSGHGHKRAASSSVNLVKSFGPVQAVRDVSLDIAPGETVALLGPNGAGKSTTIDMMLGLSRPDAGEVSLFGMPPAKAVASGRVGAMLQSGALINDLTVREYIDMLGSLYPEPAAVAR